MSLFHNLTFPFSSLFQNKERRKYFPIIKTPNISLKKLYFPKLKIVFFCPDQIQKFWKLQKSLRCFRTSLVFFIIWEDFILLYSIDVHLALKHYINGNEPVMCFNLLDLNKNILQWHRSDKLCSFFYTSSFFVTASRIGSEHVRCVWSVLFYLNIRQSRVAASPQTTGWRWWTVLGLPPENFREEAEAEAGID